MTGEPVLQPKTRRIALLAIVLLAAALRLAWIEQSPPGLQADEASNIWNAQCLLKMGVDEHGDAYPVFYTKAFGDNRSALFLYLLMPFQAIGGMAVWANRLPAALGGVASVALVYCVGRRLFGDVTAMAAALLLALDPWHLQCTRWVHESSVTPLLVLASLALLLRCGAPLTDDPPPPRRWLALLAGAFTGLACYGYAAIRLYLPLMLILAVAASWRGWRRMLATRDGARAVAALVIGFAVTFGPLVHAHLTDPEINKRGRITQVWDAADPPLTRIGKVLARYPGHFGVDFLFLHGNREPSISPPHGFGQTHWYMLPLLLTGAAVCVKRARQSTATRVLLLAVLAYPAGDLLNRHDGMNSLRSLPGLPALILLAAVGAAAVWQWLQHRRRLAITGAALAAVIVLVSNGVYWHRFFGEMNTDPAKYASHNVDIAEACRWLKPRFAEAHGVAFTQRDRSFLYPATLVYLDYSPAQWFDDKRERYESIGTMHPHADLLYRYGKVRFLFEPDAVEPILPRLRTSGPRRVIFILSPGELGLDQRFKPVKEIVGPDGQVSLQIFDLGW